MSRSIFMSTLFLVTTQGTFVVLLLKIFNSREEECTRTSVFGKKTINDYPIKNVSIGSLKSSNCNVDFLDYFGSNNNNDLHEYSNIRIISIKKKNLLCIKTGYIILPHSV